MAIRKHQCANCAAKRRTRRFWTFGGLMRHVFTYHR